MRFDQIQVTQGDRHQNITRGSLLLHQILGKRLPIAHHVLNGGGLVIDVTRVDVCSAPQKQVGHLPSLSKMQRHLAIATSRMNEGRVRPQESLQLGNQSKPRRCMSIDHSSSPDRVGRKLRIRNMEQSKPTRPPSTFCVDVRSRPQEDVHHCS